MLISRVIIVWIIGFAVSSPAWTQTLELPVPPPFPPEQELLPNDPTFSPTPQRPQPTEALPLDEVHATTESSTLPNQQELVSIMKRKLPAGDETFAVKDAPEWFQDLMQRIVRENVPDKYVHEKDWGTTDRRWDGIQIKRRGPLRLTTKRKWKEVNHGTWKRYEITQIDPQENLTMRIENVRDAGAGKVGFDVRLSSKLHVFGRLAKWAKGVQVYNVSADADADVEMQIQCEVGMKLDIRKFPPDVIMAPEVTSADLQVADFRLQKVSKLRGPLVRELSGSVQKLLVDKIEEKRDRLPEKINRQIAKNQGKMRLSLADFASDKWDELTERTAEISSIDDELRTTEKPSTAGVVQTVRNSQESVGKLNSPQATLPASAMHRPKVELLDLMPPRRP